MPKLCVLKERSIDISVLLPAEYRSSKRIKDCLAAFDRLSFKFVEKDFAGVPDNCWMADSRSYSKGYNQFHNRNVLKILARYRIEKFAIPANSGPERVYFSRQRSRREISNAGGIVQIP